MRKKIDKKDVIDYLSSHPEDLLEIANSLVLENKPEDEEKEIALIPDWEEFFMDDYKDILGKRFINKGLGIVLSSLDCPEDRDNHEFLFEQFEKWDSDGEWHCSKDYIFIQNCGDPKYKKYCLTDHTEMNIASENMYHLGSDGNLYLWTGCEDEYYKFIPLDQLDFDIICVEAIRDD